MDLRAGLKAEEAALWLVKTTQRWDREEQV